MRSSYLVGGLALLIGLPTFAQGPLPPGAMVPPVNAIAFQNEPSPLTLPRAIELALSHNPKLAAATRAVGVAEAGLIQARARPNPELSLLSEGLQKDNRVTTVQLNQEIELGGKRTARISAAEREQALVAAELASRRADLRATVIAAFFEALMAQQRLQLAQESVQLAESTAGAAARRVIAGKVSPVDETRAKVAAGGAHIELNQAASERAVARRRLATALGDPSIRVDTLATPPEADFVVPALPELLSRLAAAPQLQRAQLQVDRQQAQVAVERSRRIPDVTLSVGRKRDTTQDNLTQAVVGLSVPLPLFDRNQGNLLGALRRTEQAREELAAEQNRLTLNLSESYQRLTTAKADMETLRSEILPGAQSARDAASKGFELGKFSLSDVLDAQRTLVQSKKQYLRALLDYYLALAEIDRIVGAEQSFVLVAPSAHH